MEMNILSQVARLPGIRSSHSGLNTILGRDETIDFEDYLGGAPLAPGLPASSPHPLRHPAGGRRGWRSPLTEPPPPLDSQCLRTRSTTWTRGRCWKGNMASPRPRHCSAQPPWVACRRRQPTSTCRVRGLPWPRISADASAGGAGDGRWGCRRMVGAAGGWCSGASTRFLTRRLDGWTNSKRTAALGRGFLLCAWLRPLCSGCSALRETSSACARARPCLTQPCLCCGPTWARAHAPRCSTLLLLLASRRCRHHACVIVCCAERALALAIIFYRLLFLLQRGLPNSQSHMNELQSKIEKCGSCR